MSRLSGNAWSALGIGATGLVVGFMVGGSATPVGSVAVPAVFGLIMAGVALLQPLGTKEIVEALQKAIADPNRLTSELDPLRKADEDRRNNARRSMGKMLLVFALLYTVGMILGGLARTQHWLAASINENPIPWKGSSTQPPSVATALEWVFVQRRLLEYGYKPEDVRALYAVQEAEWKRRQEKGATSPPIHTPPQQQLPTWPSPKPTEGFPRDWWPLIPGTDAPIASRPPDRRLLEAFRPQSPLLPGIGHG